MALLVGEFVVGVRCNSAAAAATVRERFAQLLIEEPDARDNFSLALTGEQRGMRQLPSLFEADELLVRSRAHERPLASLRAVLDRIAEAPRRDCLTLRAIALRRDSQTVIAPLSFAASAQAERQLSLRGYEIVQEPEVRVALDGTLVGSDGDQEQVRAWIVPNPEAREADRVRAAQGLFLAARQAIRQSGGPPGQEVLSALKRAMVGATLVSVGQSADAVAGSLHLIEGRSSRSAR